MRTYSSESWLGYFGFKSHPTQCLRYLGLSLHQHIGLGLGERQSTELCLERGSKGAAKGRCRLQKNFSPENLFIWAMAGGPGLTCDLLFSE